MAYRFVCQQCERVWWSACEANLKCDHCQGLLKVVPPERQEPVPQSKPVQGQGPGYWQLFQFVFHKGGEFMRKLFVLVVLILLAVAGPSVMVGLAQSDTATASTSVSNNAVFIVRTVQFGAPGPVLDTDVEAGKKLIGTATFNVDATSTYSMSAVVNSGAVVAGGAVFGAGCANNACPFVLSLDGGTTFFKGDTGVSAGNNAATSGGSGTDFNLTAALCFSAPFACFSDAPNGTYTFTATMTVSD